MLAPLAPPQRGGALRAPPLWVFVVFHLVVETRNREPRGNRFLLRAGPTFGSDFGWCWPLKNIPGPLIKNTCFLICPTIISGPFSRPLPRPKMKKTASRNHKRSRTSCQAQPKSSKLHRKNHGRQAEIQNQQSQGGGRQAPGPLGRRRRRGNAVFIISACFSLFFLCNFLDLGLAWRDFLDLL